MFTSVHARAARAYQRVATETSVQGADAHKLVELLFDALQRHLGTAASAIERRDIGAKGTSIGKAVRIIEEGLKAGLNVREGGELAVNLRQVYDYSIVRLTHANLHNDAAAVAEVQALIEPIAESWSRIKGPEPAYLQPVTTPAGA
ncbi:flagellar export chaperone FliS [Hydrogenophaga sp. 5NK40-0174]|uniref:flagellar export chaperone FliS n=1 Tax=Hydrogenophaga sp. 5NK40-0174 TaxID=3127649 RepID=UPI00310B8C90